MIFVVLDPKSTIDGFSLGSDIELERYQTGDDSFGPNADFC